MLAYAGVWKPTHVDECWRILAYGSLSMSTKTNSANSHLTPTPNVQMRVWGVRAFKDTRKLWSMCVCVHTVAYQHETCRACTDRSPDLSHDTDKRATNIQRGFMVFEWICFETQNTVDVPQRQIF